MILLNKVVQILALPDGNGFYIRITSVECGQCRSIGAAFIDRHHFGFAVVTDGSAKETQRGGSVPFGGQQEVDGLTGSIYSTVQVGCGSPRRYSAEKLDCSWGKDAAGHSQRQLR